MQPGVEKHAAVAGRENEKIAADPARFVRIMFQGIAVKHRPHFGAAQGKPEMARLRSLHRVHAQTTRLCGRARKDFDIQTHATFIIGALRNWKRRNSHSCFSARSTYE